MIYKNFQNGFWLSIQMNYPKELKSTTKNKTMFFKTKTSTREYNLLLKSKIFRIQFTRSWLTKLSKIYLWVVIFIFFCLILWCYSNFHVKSRSSQFETSFFFFFWKLALDILRSHFFISIAISKNCIKKKQKRM